MNKSTIQRAFNTQFFEFFDDILRIIPNNIDVLTAKNSLELIKKSNPTILIKIWNSYIYQPYAKVIDEGDISFFFDKDYKNDLVYLADSDKIMNVIDKIREPIRSMDEHNKEISKKYIQNLSKLSSIYANM